MGKARVKVAAPAAARRLASGNLRPVDPRTSERFNPVGNERLTAGIGIVLLVLTAVQLLTILLGVHTFMSLHVFVGFVLIPALLLKLASVGLRFVRYYTRADAYVRRGPPRVAMRLLAPLLVAVTAVLFGSGVAMGFLHGHDLTVARRLHGPASVVWLLLLGVHVLVYLKRALAGGAEDVSLVSRGVAPGPRARIWTIAAVGLTGVVIGVATVPLQHHWIDLPRDRHHDDRSAK